MRLWITQGFWGSSADPLDTEELGRIHDRESEGAGVVRDGRQDLPGVFAVEDGAAEDWRTGLRRILNLSLYYFYDTRTRDHLTGIE